jgi:hypothetical protein
MMLNPAAVALIAASHPPAITIHDWWCYLVVAAAGGQVVADQTPSVLYRQHADNLIGAPLSLLRRAIAALQRGPGLFMGMLRAHVDALSAQPDLLDARARKDLAVLAAALRGGPVRRIVALRKLRLRRQTWYETVLFQCWFLCG